jgi:hypothetical protein
LYTRFLATESSDRGEIRAEVFELVERSALFDMNDLIQLVKVGYKQLTQGKKREFMYRVLLELK